MREHVMVSHCSYIVATYFANRGCSRTQKKTKTWMRTTSISVVWHAAVSIGGHSIRMRPPEPIALCIDFLNGKKRHAEAVEACGRSYLIKFVGPYKCPKRRGEQISCDRMRKNEMVRKKNRVMYYFWAKKENVDWASSINHSIAKSVVHTRLHMFTIQRRRASANYVKRPSIVMSLCTVCVLDFLIIYYFSADWKSGGKGTLRRCVTCIILFIFRHRPT